MMLHQMCSGGSCLEIRLIIFWPKQNSIQPQITADLISILKRESQSLAKFSSAKVQVPRGLKTHFPDEEVVFDAPH